MITRLFQTALAYVAGETCCWNECLICAYENGTGNVAELEWIELRLEGRR